MFSDINGQKQELLKANIWKIDRFAIHDGPGIRTNLYFKGCPLRCLWCSNPEGQHEENQLVWSENKCIKSKQCIVSCPQRAITFELTRPRIDYNKCTFCGQCVSVCPTGAWCIYGKLYTLPQIMSILEKNRRIYRRSGGGVTLSGGEPLLQVEFLQALLVKCQKMGIHTCLETCGYLDEDRFRKVLPNLNWLFIDLKHMDNEKHRKLTGEGNAMIINNVKVASSVFAQTGAVLVIRLVIVPGLNDGDNVKTTAEFASKLPHVDVIELLPYHSYGSQKYQTLGRIYQLRTLSPPSMDELVRYKSLVQSYGIKCEISGL